MADQKVQAVQQWLNDTFPAYFRYDEAGINSGTFPIKPDGMTGGNTMKALVMAIQIHYKLQPVDGVWGSGTSTACPVISASVTDPIIIRIAQGGFYCKGYEPGGFDGGFGPKLAKAIQDFKNDLGIFATTSMEQDVFKSLLTTDPTVLVGMGNGDVRAVQQYLNRNYYSYYKAKLGYIPTGGIYERKTSQAIIYAFQKEIGTTADGILGTNTFAKMPSIEIGCSNTKLCNVLQAALVCNAYAPLGLDGTYSDAVAHYVSSFQRFMGLDKDPMVTIAKVNRRTWGALLWSKGDTERKANAADCRQRLDAVKATSLYNAGYRYIGRYITKVEGGFDKNLTPEEISAIFAAGLKIFPIFQEANDSIADFTYASGYSDCKKAFIGADKLGIPRKTTLYFAVDFDALEIQAKNQITEYFKGINAYNNLAPAYKIGIYSARNTCNIICSANLATSSFVSDMSTGYSGNLGYLLPSKWAYDQYKTGSFTASDGSKFDLDSVIASDNAKYFDSVATTGDDYWEIHKRNIPLAALQHYTNSATRIMSIAPMIKKLEEAYWSLYPEESAKDCALSVLYYLWRDKYGEDGQFTSALYTNKKFVGAVSQDFEEIQNQLNNYIVGDYGLVKDDSNITESIDGQRFTYSQLMELPHLAVIVSAYLHLTPFGDVFSAPEWFGWAGDLATSLKEIKILKDASSGPTTLEHARDRIGKMEISNPPPSGLNVSGDVQMNYCDIIADLDAHGIASLIKMLLEQNENHKNLISDALEIYYESNYNQRTFGFLNEIEAEEISVDSLKAKLLDYMRNGVNLLVMLKGEGGFGDDDVEQSCACSLAEIVFHIFNN